MNKSNPEAMLNPIFIVASVYNCSTRLVALQLHTVDYITSMDELLYTI